ncbi:MAG: bifunctional demethylmenaquinone methyltransferase/2-methoxy-6-polyprenyl-1,4-benzoquinol methylase UbiE [Bdellovibrionales bacterium]|jgi:demethylmenaquinone methyltransferase/2-methoxy-6-polyprenyl-1,4-benzoquinol methylase|nr:bifunctional demethylmenaquinone methyltransferase/2-methoxy-6-polyprenyl-1,4-benzoquinol methylase UbiE [Bdellovibrionales bacterium]
MTSIDTSRKKESFKIFNDIAKTYDLLNRALSFGIDVKWRKNFIKNLPKRNGLEVLDLATGTGDVALTLGKDRKVAKVIGLDMSEGMIEIGKKKVTNQGLQKLIDLKIGDGVVIPEEDESQDIVTLAFGIRNFYDPQKALINIHRVLKKNGLAMIMEFSLPKNPLIKMFYLFYFRNLLPFVGNLVSKHKDAYTYLNKTVEDFPYGKEFTDMMENAGFKEIRIVPLTFGIASLYIGKKI